MAGFIKSEASVVVANMGNCKFFIKAYNDDASFERDWLSISRDAVNCFRTRGCFETYQELDLFRDCQKEMCGQKVDREITMEQGEWSAYLALDHEKKIK